MRVDVRFVDRVGIAQEILARVRASDAGPGGDGGSWDEIVADFEERLLRRVYPLYPSSRRLATHFGTSHTMIANKLRKYRIGRRS